MHSLMKDIFDQVLVATGTDYLARVYNRKRAIILAYHNIVPSGEDPWGDRSLHLRQEDFARQLDQLLATHEVVAISDLLAETDQGDMTGGTPRAAITFDDAYRGALTAGLRELSRRGLPATIFVSPGLVGEPAFWWDLLVPEANTALDSSIREYLLGTLGGRQERILEWADSAGHGSSGSPPAHARPATLGLLERIAGDPLVSLASHGWSHANLPVAKDRLLHRELSRPIDWFDAHGLSHQPWFAFPYGRCSERVTHTVRRQYSFGFALGDSFIPRPISNLSDLMRVPRVNIPAGISDKRFRLKTSGAR